MIGTTVSHYKILEKLGEGGMGVVYKALDLTLQRDVAVKFLPSGLSGSTSEGARFIQEARSAAALNHTNICAIYGIEESDSQTFIVMELVEGQTLQEKKASLSLKQSVDIGIQIAEGLTAAHEKGIVHRDIKPENIMIRKDGRVQIMDFGLAKLRGASRLTREGSTVGTLGYMSPEQVQGQETDHRSDIFSLGVLLYEMFAGQSPFNGVHETAIIYEIVNVDPAPMTSVKPDVNAELDAIVLECLAKEPSDRYQSAAEVAKDLRRFKRDSSRSRVSTVRPAAPAGTAAPSAAVPSGIHRERWLWAGALSISLLVIILGVLLRSSEQGPRRIVASFTIPPPEQSVMKNGAASPDGKRIAFMATRSGVTTLWVRSLGSLESQMLPGTENAAFPFWSPDGRHIGFFADGKLKKTDVAGGSPVVVCDAPSGAGGTWNQHGEILFAPGTPEGLFRVSSGGGVPKQVTSLDLSKNESAHSWPSFLPDGKRFMFMSVRVVDEDAMTYLASLDDTTRTPVLTSSANVVFAAPSHILFLSSRTLMAQQFDVDAARLLGDPYPVASGVGIIPLIGLGDFSYSPAGILTTGVGRSVNRQYEWFDRQGTSLGAACPPGNYFDIAVTVSGQTAAIQRVDVATNNSDIWQLDLRRGLISRFTFDSAVDDDPLWSSNGSYLYFSNASVNTYNIFRKAATGLGAPEMVTKYGRPQKPRDFSRDGKYLVYEVTDPATHVDAWIVPMNDAEKPFPVLQSNFDEYYPQFSPDGKWLAYASNESGKFEIYVQSFPGGGGRWQVSSNGGSQPRWRSDSKELFYVASDLKLMSVQVRGTASFDFDLAQPLFQTRIDNYTAPNRYAVVDNGRRFLLNVPVDEDAASPMSVTLYPFDRETSQ